MSESPLSHSLSRTSASFAFTDFAFNTAVSSCTWHLSDMMDEWNGGVTRVTGWPGAAVASRGRAGNRHWPCLYLWGLYLSWTVYHWAVWSACCVWTVILLHSGPVKHPEGGVWPGQVLIPSRWSGAGFHCLGRLHEWQHQINLLHQCLTLEDTRRCNSFPCCLQWQHMNTLWTPCLWILL